MMFYFLNEYILTVYTDKLCYYVFVITMKKKIEKQKRILIILSSRASFILKQIRKEREFNLSAYISDKIETDFYNLSIGYNTHRLNILTKERDSIEKEMEEVSIILRKLKGEKNAK